MSSSVFLTISATQDTVMGFACYPVLLYINNDPSPAEHHPIFGVHVNDRMAQLEKSPRRAAALAKARQRLGRALDAADEPRMGLAALRMKAGLSQAQLAEKLGTQQSNVSRWEKNPGDLQFSTIKKMAAALNVNPGDVFAAIDATQPLEVAGE